MNNDRKKDSSPPQTNPEADKDNRSKQKNPNHDAYWQSRGEERRPGDWDKRKQD
jgi:hypothetical protein